jgi:hypothetical protein
MTRATPSLGPHQEGINSHGRQEVGRLGAGNLGLPPPSKDSAEGMDASAESALSRRAAKERNSFAEDPGRDGPIE